MIRVVNVVPQGNSNETVQDSEPNIAVNPANPRQIVITAFTPDPLGSANAPIYVSTDGGTTWGLNAIVPSQAVAGASTGDITLRFAGPGGQGWDLRPGDTFYPADLDGDGAAEVVVLSPDNQWIGVLEDENGGLATRWIGFDWVNPPGGTGSTGWNLGLGDQFFVANLDGTRDAVVAVSASGQWIGVLKEVDGGLTASWIGFDWVNPPGGTGASGWNLRQGDRFFVANLDGTRDALVVVSPDTQWIGVLRESGGALVAEWIGNDWVNHPGGTGASGWNLRQGDRFFVADVDGDNRDEIVVLSPDGQYIGLLEDDNGGLAAGWIGHDWVNHPGGTGASGWNLRQGDSFYPADVDGDGADELVVLSPDSQYIGVLEGNGSGLAAGWIGYDWVNPPGGAGQSGWDLHGGDRFIVARLDGTRDALVVVSSSGQWIGVLKDNGGVLNADWIGQDWVNPPGGSGPSGWDLRQGDRFFVADVDDDNRAELVVVSPDGQWIGLLREVGGALAADWIANNWVAQPGGPGAMLAGGILRAGLSTHLQAIRTTDFTQTAPMTVLLDGNNVDQPYTEAIRPTKGVAAGNDVLYIGANDFNDVNGRTAAIVATFDATRAAPAFTTIRLENRNTSGQDGPPIRPAVHPDGTVYAVFSGWRSFNAATGARTADVVVVRDDDWGRSASPFSALVDPGDNRFGMRVATGVPFTFNLIVGQERVSCPLSIAVDPRSSDTVWVAWGDQPGGTPTLHVRRSTDRGQNWSPDLITINGATNPALAVIADGTVGFMYQQLTGVAANTRWDTHIQRSPDGGTTWVDRTLATVPSGVPMVAFRPYLGDYLGLLAVGDAFYGTFSANNTPRGANFPNGVRFLRNANWQTNVLRNVANSANVAVSIDPFFVKVTPAPDAAEVRVTCTTKAGGGIGTLEALGGIENGLAWRLTVAQVIDRIETDGQVFFVEEPVGDRVDVVIATTPRGRRYVKTVADGDIPNNLLSLPDCP